MRCHILSQGDLHVVASVLFTQLARGVLLTLTITLTIGIIEITVWRSLTSLCGGVCPALGAPVSASEALAGWGWVCRKPLRLAVARQKEHSGLCFFPSPLSILGTAAALPPWAKNLLWSGDASLRHYYRPRCQIFNSPSWCLPSERRLHTEHASSTKVRLK